MPRRVVDIDDPDRFVAAVDVDDADGCYIEAVRRRRRISVLLEREQLALLARGVLGLVDELERRGLVAIDVGPLDGPPERPARRHAFRAEMLSMAWDDDGHRVVIEARSAEAVGGAGESVILSPPADEELEDLSDDDPLGPDVLRVRLRPHAAQRFMRQARWLTGGRPAAGADGRDAP